MTVTIDAQGALHATDGRYAAKTQDVPAFDLLPQQGTLPGLPVARRAPEQQVLARRHERAERAVRALAAQDGWHEVPAIDDPSAPLQATTAAARDEDPRYVHQACTDPFAPHITMAVLDTEDPSGPWASPEYVSVDEHGDVRAAWYRHDGQIETTRVQDTVPSRDGRFDPAALAEFLA